MITDHLNELLTWNVVLASGSPRRLEIFQKNMSLHNTRVICSTFDESSLDKSQFAHPSEFVVENARQKALQVASTLSFDQQAQDQDSPTATAVDLLVSADTIVSFGDEILEKPVDADHARKMLRKLSGREHTVYTGVCFIVAAHRITKASASARANMNQKKEEQEQEQQEAQSRVMVTFVEETTVMFDELSDELIEAYIETGEPFDKAGSYGIQEKGGMFVRGIKGCYFNVMGFPMQRFTRELAQLL